MSHLTPEQFVDLVDGVEDAVSRAHLDACAGCRQELAAVRSALAAAVDIEVPEPSPLFWDHLSARVGQAVSAVSDDAPGRAVSGRLPWPPIGVFWLRRALAPAAVLATATAVVLAVALVMRPVPGPPAGIEEGGRHDVERTATAPSAVQTAGDDPSLDLIAELVGDDWDVVATSLAVSAGTADLVVEAMDDEQRAELERLLHQEMAAR